VLKYVSFVQVSPDGGEYKYLTRTEEVVDGDTARRNFTPACPIARQAPPC
jgi:hypothetical protein